MHFFRELLKELKIRHTAFYVDALVAERTDAYTLFGVKKLLETYGVRLTAVRIASKDVTQLDYPCVVMYSNYLTLLKAAPEEIDVFQEEWNGVALMVDETDKAREPHYYRNLFRWVLSAGLPYAVVFCLLGLMVLSLVGNAFADGYRLLLLLLNGVGAFFSWRTVQGECSSSCYSVLESAGSKLFGLYSLGVIGLAYFATNSIVGLTIPAFEPTVSLLSVPALLMPLWSIPYQMFVVKAWCKNCLGVQLTLVLSFVVALLYHRIDPMQLYTWPALGTMALYAVVFYLCQYVYQLLQKNKAIPQSMIGNYHALLRDPVVRKQILESGELRDTQGASQLILHQSGDDNEKEMLLVLSPYCSHCRTLFFKVRELIALGKLKGYKVALVFSPSPQGLPVYGSVICEYQQNGAEAAIKLLVQWYDSTKVKRFQKKLDAYEKTAAYTAELERQQTWCDKQDFTGVPVLLIDSRVVNHALIDGIIN